MKKVYSISEKLKFVLAGLCLLSLFEMPYSYYEIFRVIALTSFIFLAYNEKDKGFWPLIWIASAILIQPFHKFNITRWMWMIIDFLWAFLLIFSLFKDEGSIKNNSPNIFNNLKESKILKELLIWIWEVPIKGFIYFMVVVFIFGLLLNLFSILIFHFY